VLVDSTGRRQVIPMPDTDEFRRLMFAAVLGRLRDPGTFVCDTAIAEQHSRLIEDLQQIGKVRELPSAHVERLTDPGSGSELLSVTGLAEALDRALADGATLASVADFATPQLVTQ